MRKSLQPVPSPSSLTHALTSLTGLAQVWGLVLFFWLCLTFASDHPFLNEGCRKLDPGSGLLKQNLQNEETLKNGLFANTCLLQETNPGICFCKAGEGNRLQWASKPLAMCLRVRLLPPVGARRACKVFVFGIDRAGWRGDEDKGGSVLLTTLAPLRR